MQIINKNKILFENLLNNTTSEFKNNRTKKEMINNNKKNRNALNLEANKK
jgi:hypothetical protein